jgi:SOS response regulatory protein OraA/RecX
MNKSERDKFNKELKEFIEEAKENRHDFLKPYREKFESAESHGPRAEIVVELIKIEPSHLSEQWIIFEVISWLRNHDYIDYLEEAFIRQRGRKRLTEGAKFKKTRDRLLVKKVDKMKEQAGKNVSRAELFRQLANQQRDKPTIIIPEDHPDHDLPELIKKIYYEYKRDQKKATEGLPYPYYGLDISIERGHLELFYRK